MIARAAPLLLAILLFLLFAPGARGFQEYWEFACSVLD